MALLINFDILSYHIIFFPKTGGIVLKKVCVMHSEPKSDLYSQYFKNLAHLLWLFKFMDSKKMWTIEHWECVPNNWISKICHCC